jgi:hypothetical protein
MKGLLVDAYDKMKTGVDDTDKKLVQLTEGVNEKFDAHMAAMGAKIESIKTSFDAETLRLLDERVENLKNVFDENALQSIHKKIDEVKAAYDLEAVKLLYEKIENIDKGSTAKTAAAITKAASRITTAEKNMNRAVESVKKKESEIKSMLNDVRKMNVRLSKMDDTEFMVRVLDARKRVVRLPRMAPVDKKRVNDAIVAVENDILDLSIIAIVKKQKMNAALLKKKVLASGKKVEERLKVLVDNNRIKKERLGRYFVYSAA